MGRRIATSTYRRLLRPIGRRRLERMLADGLPARFRDPLEYLLTKDLSPDDREIVGRIDPIRSRMAERGDLRVVELYASPLPGSAGTVDLPAPRPAPGGLRTVPIGRVASRVSVPAYWGTFLYLCANSVRARTILELGACAGISACYLASGRRCERFVTIEGSAELAALAESNLRQVARHAAVIHDLFDPCLDRLLPTLAGGVDLFFLDGQHEKVATFHYVDRVAPHLNDGSVLVFDDIRWNADMWEAWGALSRREGVAVAIDVGRYGICAWDGVTTRSRYFDFSRFADLWKWGSKR